MADDSVLEPYPNLKVPQWHFQIETLPRLKDEASTSFWQAVEKDGESLLHWLQANVPEMAPYLSHIKSTNQELLSSLKAKNEKELSTFEEKLKDAEENLGESEISELLRNKAMYLCRIGDKVSHPTPFQRLQKG